MALTLFMIFVVISFSIAFAKSPAEAAAGAATTAAGDGRAPLVPAFFIIGDSLVDPGNNNYIVSLAKSNFRPYGMQFDTRMPTGRFSNGRLIADYIAALLGLPLPPAYLDPNTRGARLLRGVNFASAGAGIIDNTGNIFVGRVPFSVQVTQFGKVKQEITSLIGINAAETLIRRSIVGIFVGSNDYTNNYLFRATPEAKLPPQQFQDLLISTYGEQVKRLYEIGVRKVVAFNIPPIGCIPRSLAFYGSVNGECIQFVNDFAINFNREFKPLIDSLRESLPGLQITLSDSYGEFFTIYNNPSAFGFAIRSVACCGKGRFNGAIQCLPNFPSCPDFDQRVFWDSFHPTARANSFLANFSFFGGRNFNDPVDVQQLARM